MVLSPMASRCVTLLFPINSICFQIIFQENLILIGSCFYMCSSPDSPASGQVFPTWCNPAASELLMQLNTVG